MVSDFLKKSKKGAVKKQPVSNGGFQKWDPPLVFSDICIEEYFVVCKMGITISLQKNRFFLERF